VCLHIYIRAGEPDSVPRPLAWFFAMGGMGVDVFFTLSAFLLTLPFVESAMRSESAPSLAVYTKRRLLRILPAYYVQIAVLVALGAIGVNGGWVWNSPSATALLAHVVFYLNAWPFVAAQVPPWWTLPVEMGFYLLLPLFARCLRPGRRRWLLLAIVASLAYRFWLMHAGLSVGRQIVWGDHLPGRLHQFLIGMFAAYAFASLKARNALPNGQVADWLAAAAVVAFIALPALGFPITGQAYLGEPNANPLLQCWHLFASVIVSALLVSLAVGAPVLSRIFSWPPLQGLGLISYSLYLWHYPVMLAVRDALGGFDNARGDFWTYFGHCLLMSVIVAVASWWIVERPAQLWGRRIEKGALAR
jgi:peptidoglycan/LPS O-acetylase OafA/YrhL